MQGGGRRSTTRCALRATVPGASYGVGLVEVMVSAFLLGVGALAISGMQLSSLRFTGQVAAASAAQTLAIDIIDRMRGNPDGVSNGHYDGKSTSSAHAAVSCSEQNGCDAATLANHDLYRWSRRLHNIDKVADFRAELPSAADGTLASATVKKLDPGLYRVEVNWYETGSTSRTLSMDFAP